MHGQPLDWQGNRKQIWNTSEMATYGLGDLAAEATEILGQKADQRAGEERQPGQGAVTIDGKLWRLWGYGEELRMTEELASLLKLAEPGIEKRQCVTISIAAATEWRDKERRPTLEETRTKAQQFCWEQAASAKEAEEGMCIAEEVVTPVEHELRIHGLDLVTSAHEQDFRSLSILTVSALDDVMLVVVRADYRGGLVLETVQGKAWKRGGWIIPILIWKGHMALLQPPEDLNMEEFIEKEDHVSTPALGFEFFWHTRHDQARTAPGKTVCRLCKTGKKAGEVEWVVRSRGCLAKAATVAGGPRPTTQITMVVRGLEKSLVFQEVAWVA
eukprot:s503_g6.t1